MKRYYSIRESGLTDMKFYNFKPTLYIQKTGDYLELQLLLDFPHFSLPDYSLEHQDRLVV
jgi:hypothetical protein